MSKEQIKQISDVINWIGKGVFGLMLAFCTFVLNQMWAGWKEHDARDAATAQTVVEQGLKLETHSKAIDFLTSRELNRHNTNSNEKD